MPWKWNKSAVNSMSTPLCPGIVHDETPAHSHMHSHLWEDDRGRSTALDAHQLQKLYLSEIARYVRRRVDSIEETEDITADVFAAAFAALPKFRHECEPRIWLLRIAHRCVLTSARRRKTRFHVLHEFHNAAHDYVHDATSEAANHGTAESPEALLERAEAQRVLRELMGNLKAEQREALRLQYWEGLSINEIAVVMKRSPAAVNSLLQRARKTLFERGKDYFLKDEVTL
jgi:RNA polymerase sigma-70 factor (ECF subfamily)